MFTATKFLALFTLAITSKVVAVSAGDDCDTEICTTDENLVWTTSDSGGCVVAVNRCELANENCRRRERGVAELYEIGKEDCQNICEKTACTRMWTPICGSYNNNTKTFPNECEMRKFICTNGQVYTVRTCDEN